MAGNIQIPQDVAKTIKVEDTSDALRRFLVQLVDNINELETRISKLEKG